jgi:hypothetical protein
MRLVTAMIVSFGVLISLLLPGGRIYAEDAGGNEYQVCVDACWAAYNAEADPITKQITILQKAEKGIEKQIQKLQLQISLAALTASAAITAASASYAANAVKCAQIKPPTPQAIGACLAVYSAILAAQLAAIELAYHATVSQKEADIQMFINQLIDIAAKIADLSLQLENLVQQRNACIAGCAHFREP